MPITVTFQQPSSFTRKEMKTMIELLKRSLTARMRMVLIIRNESSTEAVKVVWHQRSSHLQLKYTQVTIGPTWVLANHWVPPHFNRSSSSSGSWWSFAPTTAGRRTPEKSSLDSRPENFFGQNFNFGSFGRWLHHSVDPRNTNSATANAKADDAHLHWQRVNLIGSTVNSNCWCWG